MSIEKTFKLLSGHILSKKYQKLRYKIMEIDNLKMNNELSVRQWSLTFN